MNNDRTMTLVTEDGKEIVCEILFTTHSEEFGKDYVVFTTGENEVSAASYVETGEGSGNLEPVEIDAEWEMLEDLLEEYVQQLEANTGCQCQGECTCGEECECDGECDGEECCCGKNSN